MRNKERLAKVMLMMVMTMTMTMIAMMMMMVMMRMTRKSDYKFGKLNVTREREKTKTQIRMIKNIIRMIIRIKNFIPFLKKVVEIERSSESLKGFRRRSPRIRKREN